MRLNAYEKVRSGYLHALREGSQSIAANLTKFEAVFIYVSLVIISLLLSALLILFSVYRVDNDGGNVCVDFLAMKRGGAVSQLLFSTPHIVTISVFMASSSAFIALITAAGVRTPAGGLFFTISFFALLAGSFVVVMLGRHVAAGLCIQRLVCT